jgi:hypothetical protein
LRSLLRKKVSRNISQPTNISILRVGRSAKTKKLWQRNGNFGTVGFEKRQGGLAFIHSSKYLG